MQELIELNKNSEKIERLRKIEGRAQRLQMQLWDQEQKWEKLVRELRGTKEWAAYCERTGYVPNYKFGDILA
jgi:CRISPR/Cas system-associated endonuclease Cas1